MNGDDEQSAKLLGSLLLFTRVFYELRTGRAFKISEPIARESHHITVAKALMKVFRGETRRLIINLPPRYGKTEMVIHFCAWALAHFSDANFIYVSYSHSLAKKQTQTIRQIAGMPQYRKLFNVQLSGETSAKDNFETTSGGSVYAAGAGGTITGRGAGISGIKRFGGAIIIDDIHKPDEVTSDTIRDSTNEWYLNTMQSRVNDPSTPIIFIGQRLHEDDLPSNLQKGFDGEQWETVILKSLDEVGNALDPAKHSKEALLIMKDKMPYVFSSQYQQDPQPAGGGIFKPEWFVLLEEEPKLLATFITVDTAETEKTYNDATVFSFFGIYKIEQYGIETDLYALHWIDCLEDWVEPKDLKDLFLQFYSECMRHPVKPKIASIEKKSTGVTLISTIRDMQGLNVIEIERTNASGSKTKRFLDVQPYAASKQISFPMYGKHTRHCLEHMRKITANNTHRYDDIADTLADGIKLGLIDKVIPYTAAGTPNIDLIVAKIASAQRNQQDIRNSTWQQ